MAKISTSSRKPGAQNPQKYGGNVGPNYLQWGEQPGYVYIPSRDQYYENPKELQKQLEDSGAVDKPPKPDSLLETVGPLGASAAAIYGGKELGSRLFGASGSGAPAAPGAAAGEGSIISQGYDAVKNALGFGGASQAPVTNPASTGMFFGPGGNPASFGPSINADAYEANLAANPIQPTGMFSGGPLANGLGVAGVGLGGWQAYEGIKDQNPFQSGMGGLGVGLGLNSLGLTLGVPGFAAAVGIPIALSMLSGLGDKDMWKTEKNRLEKLKESGAYIPDGLLQAMPTKGRSRDELVKIAEATGGNVEFARSRDESLLKPQDIIGYSAFVKRDPEWFKKSLDEQLAVAKSALDAGAVKEHHGTIDVDWSKVGGATPVQVPLNQAKPMTTPVPAITQGMQVAPSTQTPIVNAPPSGMFNPTNVALRSSTRSPGIDNQGRRIVYA